MTQDINNKDNLDPCPDTEVLKAYSEGGTSEDVQSIIESHLEFCASCRSKMEGMGKPGVPFEKSVEILAHRLKQRQEQILRKQNQGPVLGTIWRTVPSSEQELYGPMVIVIDENKDKADIVQAAEISENIPQAIETDMILEPADSRLSFRCMVRTGNTFFTEKKNLKTFAGKLSPLLTTKVVRFCKSQNQFNDEVPLSEYVFVRDQEGNELMRRRGVTSGMLVTKDDDSRLNFLEESKKRCSYLIVIEEGATGSGGPVRDLGIAATAPPAEGTREQNRTSLVKKLWPIAAMLFVAVVTAKTTQVIMEAPLKSEAQVAAEKIPATDKTPAVSSAPKQGKRRAPGIYPPGARDVFAIERNAFRPPIPEENRQSEAAKIAKEWISDRRTEMEALKLKVSKIEHENLDLKKRNAELLDIQDGMNERLAQAEKRREGPVTAMSEGRLEFDSVKGKAVLEAVQSGNLTALKELLQEDQYVGYRDDETGVNPLHMAVAEGKTAVAKFLIEKGANVNTIDNEGKTPLMKAAMNGDRGMVELLLDKGADIRMSDMGGRTALYWALVNKHDDIASLLRRF